MGNLNLILFISLAAPLLMALFVCKGKSRTLLTFLFIGMVVCLFCGELNTITMNMLPYDSNIFTCNLTPLIEEVCKALPILVYAFLYKPKRQTLLECSVLVGLGFAIQENAFIFISVADMVSLPLALIRGFAAGISHGLTTLAVGYGMTFVHTRRKLFYTGTTALLITAIIYHSVYNTLVQSAHQLVGFLLPFATLIPVLVLLKKTRIQGNVKKGLMLFSLALLLLGFICMMEVKDWKDNSPTQEWQDVFQLTETIGHDKTSYTEGLFVYNGDLYESTGLNDHSRLTRYKGISQNEIIAEQKFNADVFAEGSAVLNGTLYMLTWQNKVVLLFNPKTLEQEDILEYPHEGWGLTSNGKELIASDGSDCLYFIDNSLQLMKTLHVSCGGKKLKNINELEYDGRYIWANVWQESYIVAIDTENGNVVLKVDFSELLPENASKEYCLNGIAFDGEYYYFTGKNWPVMYKMKLIDDKIK